MHGLEWATTSLLLLSIGANAFSFFLIKRLKNKVKNGFTADAKQLLGDLMQGQAVIHIRVIDPSSILLRSPK